MKLTRNFQLKEFRCKDKKKTPIPVDLIPNVKRLASNLQVLSYVLALYWRTTRVRITVLSGYRTPEHNAAVKGEKGSLHLQAMAADIKAERFEDDPEKGIFNPWVEIHPWYVREAILRSIKEGTMQQGGVGLYDTFVHYDCRGVKKRWDRRKVK